ncbi:MAG: hypothetical protein IT306_04880 [Chloroflexi bacterium]|nr:hypothetical protein [Chloroflexota bacterium]
MARPGKHRPKHAPVKRVAARRPPLAPISPDDVAAAINELEVATPGGGEGLADEILAVFDDLTEGDQGRALALIDAMGNIREESAGLVLAALAEILPDKEQRKAARRALHKLKSAGIEVALPMPIAEPRPAVESEPHHMVEARVSAIDGVGSRVLWLLLERPVAHLGMVLYSIAINDTVGVKDMFAEPASRRSFGTTTRRFSELSEQTVVGVPTEYGLALLSEALALNKESRFPVPLELQVRMGTLPPLPPPPAQALIHQWITRGQSLLMPTLLEESEYLLESEPETDGWFFGYDESEPFALQLERARTSSLITTLNPNEDPRERVVNNAIDTLFTPSIRRAYRRRLEETAYIFWKTDRERQARQAVAAAFAIPDTGSLHSHPLIRAIIRKSIVMAVQADASGYGPPPDASRTAYTPI